MSTEAHAPDRQEALAAMLRCVQYRIHLSMRQQADDSRESERQVPDHHDDDDDEPDTTDEPVDCDSMEPAVPKGVNKRGVPRGRAVMLRPRPKLLPRTAAEKKGAARYTVRRDWQRIPDWMLRVKLVREAEALEALAAARGCSAQVYPTASMLAVPPFPLTITPKLRSTKSVVAPHQKRKRATDGDDVDEVIDAHDAKRRRVGSDASSLSRAVDRPVAGNTARGGRTGATANPHHKLTTSAASRVPRTITRVPATPINCPAPRRSASVVGNAKVEKVLLSVPEFNPSGHVLLKRDATPPQASPPPRQRRMIPHPKAAPAVTTGAPADAPSPKQSSSAGESTPTPTPTNKPLGRTMLSRQATSMFGAGVATPSSAPLLPSPSPSPSPSAGPSQASKPTPTNKPLGRTMLSRQSTSMFGADVATPGASAGESMPTPPPTNKPLGRTMLSRQATSLFGADVATPSPSSSAPLSLSPSPSAGPSQASKPTPTNKPLGRTLLSRQPTSLFGADVAGPSASAGESIPTPTPTPTPTNRSLGRTMLRRQPTSLFAVDVPTPRASAPSPQSSPPLSLSPPPTPSQASRPISTPYRAPSKKTVHPAPATARGKGKGKKAYREILPPPEPAPEPVPQVSTREEFRQRWLQVFGEEPPADPEAEASIGGQMQMDDAASA